MREQVSLAPRAAKSRACRRTRSGGQFLFFPFFRLCRLFRLRPVKRVKRGISRGDTDSPEMCDGPGGDLAIWVTNERCQRRRHLFVLLIVEPCHRVFGGVLEVQKSNPGHAPWALGPWSSARSRSPSSLMRQATPRWPPFLITTAELRRTSLILSSIRPSAVGRWARGRHENPLWVNGKTPIRPDRWEQKRHELTSSRPMRRRSRNTCESSSTDERDDRIALLRFSRRRLRPIAGETSFFGLGFFFWFFLLVPFGRW